MIESGTTPYRNRYIQTFLFGILHFSMYSLNFIILSVFGETMIGTSMTEHYLFSLHYKSVNHNAYNIYNIFFLNI